jgi:dihydroneopterin aldolase
MSINMVALDLLAAGRSRGWKNFPPVGVVIQTDSSKMTDFCHNDLMSMDTVFIRELRIETVIGIYEWERKIKQPVILDLEMGTDITRAAASDAIEDTLDYKAVSKRLIEFVEASEFQLVETLAERCAEILLQEFQLPWIRLTLNKIGALSAARDVGVIIERGARV